MSCTPLYSGQHWGMAGMELCVPLELGMTSVMELGTTNECPSQALVLLPVVSLDVKCDPSVPGGSLAPLTCPSGDPPVLEGED